MATMYWLGTTSTAWATASNWTLNSNGTVNTPAAAPTTTDTAVFNSFSGGGVAAGSVVIGAAITVTGLTVVGSPGVTLTSSVAASFTVSGTTSYQGGTFTLSNTGAAALGTVSVTSAASSGTFTVSNTTTCSTAGITFAATGANFTIANSTTLTIGGTVQNTGSSGTLRLTNGTTQDWTNNNINFTSTGSNLIVGGTNISNLGTITVPVGATGGTLTVQNAGTIACGTFTYASNNAVVLFTSAVTTVTFSTGSTLAISAAYTNVTFNCTALSFNGQTAFKAGPCNMTCNLIFNFSSSCTITSDITTTGTLTTSGTASLVLNSYIITCLTASVNNTVSWNFGTGTGSGPQITVTGTTGTVLNIGASFTKTIVSPSTGAFYLTGGGSSARSVVTQSSSVDFANVYITSGTFTLTPASGSLYFGVLNCTGFTGTLSSATVMTVSGSLTFGTGMTVSTGGLTFVGTGTYTSNGVLLPSGCNVTINGAGITVTLGDSPVHYNSLLNVWQGTLNLNDKTFEVLKLSQYNGNSVSVVTIGINGGPSSSGTIIVRGTGASSSTAGVAPFFGPYTNGGSTYTVTNNPTVIMQPTDANVIALATVGIYTYMYTAEILPNIIVKNSVGGLSYTATFSSLSGNSPIFLSLTFDTNFTGTYNPGAAFNITVKKDLFIGANCTMGTSTTAGFATAVTSGSGTITVNQTVNRPFTITNTAGIVSKLLTSVTTNQLLTLTTGTLDLNGKTFTSGTFATGAGTKNLTFNGGYLFVTGSGATAFNNANPTGFTTSAGTAKGYIYMSNTLAKTFVGGGSNYAATLVQAGAGALTLSGNNTLSSIKNTTQPAPIIFTSSSTTTFVDNFQLKGTGGSLIVITATTAGTGATVSKSSGFISCDYISVKDNLPAGGASWYAGAHSTLVSNFTGVNGWYQRPPPSANTEFLTLFT